ncbi:MAG: ABC transporter transmembrane domain-containing protein [Marinibacterium sp.]|nr:ABC transporter transmembrane domain-containing protein [Marinibacterium sp.]
MEPTIFSFIWKYSKKQQIGLLLFTIAVFPFIYASLELPKRIINDAIGAEYESVDVMGVELSQYEFLIILCFGFLATVLVSGLMKMRLNTMKGILAERLLRRLRYTLIARMMRFPRSYFRTTSQGELVSMVTSESEPMGGLMGDAVAQPVFQAGQMLTIVAFLFAQSVWFGLASIALIPLQAWLIPMLQRQINLLNKERIKEIRQLSAEIGETAQGVSDLRENGGWRYRQAQISERLGRLFQIRFRIYNKKFFMKFLNNFITQLTPFFFYAVGGYLAIKGQITVGALVAALAAYKDIASPWKELLTYYNQVQDMSLRWRIVTERFAPADMIPPDLFDGEPSSIPNLQGDIVFDDVYLVDQDGNTLLEGLNLTIPSGSRVAIKCPNPLERRAVAELLAREIRPTRGTITIAGHPLDSLHQTVIATRIGYAHSRPYLFDGTLGDNLVMPLRMRPLESEGRKSAAVARRRLEAQRAGNSTDPIEADWVDPGVAGLNDSEELRDWWFQLIEAVGQGDSMLRRSLQGRLDPVRHAALARDIVGLRDAVAEELAARGLDLYVYRFDPERFNPAVALGGNLLYAAPAREISQTGLASEYGFLQMLRDNDLADEAIRISQAVIQTLQQTFGVDGTDHPLFRKLGMDPDVYRRLVEISGSYAHAGRAGLSDDECALMLTVPFLLTAEQIGPGFPDQYKDKILHLRRTRGAAMREQARDLFQPLDAKGYAARLTVLENALYGRVSLLAGAHAEEIETAVIEVLQRHDLDRRLAILMTDVTTGIGGANLPTVVQERAAFSRAGLKRPDVLVLDKALASQDSQARAVARRRLQSLLPRSTMIFMEDHFENPQLYDQYIEIRNGRIDGDGDDVFEGLDESGADDLRKKLRIISGNELFERLDPRNQRLLAYSAQWYKADAGQEIFAYQQPADAAYLCLKGEAEIRWPHHEPDQAPIAVIEAGRLVGDLTVILRERRQVNFVARTECQFLRIGAEEFRSVIENDVDVAVSLLEAVASNMSGLVSMMRNAGVSPADLVAGIDPGGRSFQDVAQDVLADHATGPSHAARR